MEDIAPDVLSVKGKKVLHIDRNDHYGGEAASINIEALFKKYGNDNGSEPWKKYGRPNDWNIDLVPKLLMSNGELTNILVSTDVTRYLEFKQIAGSYVQTGAGNKANVAKVPSDASEALRSPLMGLFEKRRAKKFLEFVGAYKEDDPATHNGMNLNQSTMKEVYDKYGLEASTRDFIGHSMALYTTDDYINQKGAAKDAVERIRLYVNSMARYGKSPYIYPLYGLGELPQGFARLSAIYGGTYMLNTDVDEVLYENGKAVGIKATMKERDQEGEGMTFTTKCSKILADPSYFPNKVKPVGHLLKAICILNHPIEKTDNSDSVQLIIPQSQIGRKHDVYVAMVSWAHNVAPKGYYIAIVSTIAEGDSNHHLELQAGFDRLGKIEEKFMGPPIPIYEPLESGENDNIFISRSYDATSHFETTTDDIRDIYRRAEGQELVVEGLREGQNLVAEEFGRDPVGCSFRRASVVNKWPSASNDKMRVIEVIIDGFKSYAVRTVISGWDESFNSITGLNGSGKSNILDSICFVLGITNMTTVRAQNLQDLIYKRGQAGVTKASVTIVFDNKDKAKSPIGFEDYPTISVTRQIVLGGTSKYLINGHRAQQTTVQNLFQSVQLNINNPNFLIMQGRITKVLNMKKEEILGMVEEAAGTRMFEDRRDKAFRTMAKKEMKVQEIMELLRDEIEPKLDKLRQEKRAFLDFQQTQNDLERLTRLVVAYDYLKSKEKLRMSEKDLNDKRERAIFLESNAEKLKNEIAFLQEDMDKVKAARDKELRKGGKFQALEDKVKEHSHELVRLTTVLDLKKSSMTEEKENREKSQAAVQELGNQLEQKSQLHKQLQERYDAANAELQKQTAEVEQKEELLQTLQTGVASKEGQEGGYQGQLQDARNRLSAASTEQEQAKLKISHLEKRLKEDEPRAKKAEKENAGLLKSLDGLRSEAKGLEAELSRIGYESGREEAMQKEQSQLQQRIRELKEKADGLKRRVANIDFSYSDPTPNFDRSKVKGLVAQLFNLDKNFTQAGTALEICAGGRLYNVVVDTAQTGTQLLQNGKLKKRVTIIPLNKISAFRAASEKIGAARSMSNNKCDLALNLIGYEEDVNAAMEYVFGNTLICEDAATAKKVTFDPAVRMKSVTLEGDVYDPSGTLSGGSSPKTSGVLVTLQQLNEITRELDARQAALHQLQSTMAQEKQKLDAARKFKQNLDLKNHEISLAEQQINGNSSSSIIQAIADTKSSIVELKQSIIEAKTRQDEAAKEVKRIEKDMKDFNNNKDSKLVELQTALDKLKKSLSKNSAAIRPLQQEVRDAMLEAEQCGSDLAAAQEQFQDAEVNLKTQQEELKSLMTEGQAVKDAHHYAQAQLDDERKKLSGYDTELADLEAASRSKSALITEEALEAQKLGHQIENFSKQQQAARQTLQTMEKEHEWIADEVDSFGRSNTPYDFNGMNMGESKRSLAGLNERFQGMKKKINPKVMNMIDSVEKKEASLKNMMRTVVRDKTKIEETIAQLDEYKKEALHKTWSKVNVDFGNIFNELLPGGNTAKLDPPEDSGDISKGLEVKVCLGKVWKQSLTELSGGQRSLIALSLILALLQYSPAPMYILDEVDAALDLSHTQNIGRLIKTRFKGSQFIVVSLKDGMFQNANKIFKTRFSDGTSVVQVLTPADLK
ncbi:putative nuclear condensin complex subunit Smc2 [Aureobasidium sp. EXF-3400]|nr:putative nuclear condensin complex subunit Smc2 [Aureobasidium sp. EXF-12344]KAI4772878.1 putative nuclear condensin complex subunit Smc2 [Aureobasidium sp. EXF-3400]